MNDSVKLLIYFQLFLAALMPLISVLILPRLDRVSASFYMSGLLFVAAIIIAMMRPVLGDTVGFTGQFMFGVAYLIALTQITALLIDGKTYKLFQLFCLYAILVPFIYG